ncbi:non-ribosomal peptide synthetase [Candidatus Uabimicrobium amorphum]|uniref:Non-ribosomal peptide synthetase n=1 Tax=Uabimicrobium amorphum TaxID=2596890 RepID=A0A5S9F3C9_UABAM|nr:non-ribosomal peptide synthetase [Candidatus Uabimicrobium amorphum]BBM84605.1 non-ribosomal peptide synthetase [Candidatus Uabimicrobium amorphum]
MSSQNTVYNLVQNITPQQRHFHCILNQESKSIVYGELLQHIEEKVTLFREWGIKRNERIAIVLPNGPEMASAFLTVACAATSAPLNPKYTEKEYKFYLTDLNAKAVIVPHGEASPVRIVADKLSIPILELQSNIEKPGMFDLTKPSQLPTQSVTDVDFCQEQDIALVLHTSGTTSRPKIVPLSHSNICNSAKSICRTLQLQSHDCCLNIMPLFHIHGLMGVLLSSIVARASICCTTGFAMQDFFSWVKINNPTWYSAVPTMHQAILMESSASKDIIKNSRLRLIRSSSSSLPPVVLKNLEKTFSVPVIEAYGMTEASHQMTSNPLPPSKRKPGSVGIATNIEVDIMDEQGNILPTGSVGEIVIKGNSVTNGYENNPQANSEAFVDSWFRTGDLGYLDQDRYLFINGRVKEIINRGGEKISPHEVDEVLLEFPHICQAVTFAVPHKRLGEDVAAAVIVEKGFTVGEQQLRNFAFTKLAEFKVPSQIIFVDKIPLGPTGKMQRIGLADKLENELKRPCVLPSAPLEKEIAKIWSEVLDVDNLSIHDNFFICGGDSLMGARVVNRINKQLQLQLPIEILFRYPTIQQQYQFICEDTKKHNFSQSIPRVSRSEITPLSFVQERVWYLHNIAPEGITHNRPCNLLLLGKLNINILQESLQKLLQRHETLRMLIAMDSVGRPVQKILENTTMSLYMVDLSSFDQQQQQQEIQNHLHNEVTTPFAIEKETMVRGKLLKVNAEKYLLLMTFHHMIFDGWSQYIFIRDLANIYQATSGGESVDLNPLPIQYTDFAAWSRKQDFRSRIAYWKEHLANLPILELPKDKMRPKSQSYQGKKIPLSFTKTTYQNLKAQSRKHEVTLFTTVLSVFYTLLYKYSQQQDIVVGVPFAGRDTVEVENLIGMFMNPLPMRICLSDDITFADLLKKVHTTYLQAHSNQMPLQLISKELGVKRSANYESLFQTLFIFENFPTLPKKMDNIDILPEKDPSEFSFLDISFEFVDNQNELQGFFFYATDLFHDATAQKFVDHFCHLIDEIITNPQQRISQLQMVSDEERAQLIAISTGPQREIYPRCFHELFTEQAKKTPNQTAAIFCNQRITYHQLDCRANQLAHYLHAQQPAKLIAILMDRNLDFLVTILAIFKMGAAYLPLSPKHPQKRHQQIIDSSGVSHIITCDQYSALAKKLCVNKIYNISSIDFEKLPTQQLNISTELQDLAYVIYTSGSTGLPKGAMVNHKGMVNHIYAKIEDLELTAQDIIAQTASQCFDISVWQFLANLLVGGCVQIFPDDVVYDPQTLVHEINDNQISIWETVPSLMKLILNVLKNDPMPFARLRWLIPTGEVLSPHLAKEWLQSYPQIPLVNAYGPTECSDDVTHYVIDTPPTTDAHNMPIGKPIRNITTYVLDKNLHILPVGIPGELHVGGVGVGDGYLNDEQRTKKVFIKNPFSQTSTKLYKTGDIAKYLPDGNIQFLGRLDNQVKLRGLRIELGEIEVALERYPQIQQAAVVYNEQLLIAYIVTHREYAEKNLRIFLEETLPQYMIPQHFVCLESMPLNANGKIDRKQLHLPQNLAVLPYQEPRNKEEQIIAEVFADVCHCEKVSVHDDFFDLGGHSLLIFKLRKKILQKTNKQIPIAAVFEHKTVESLAKFLKSIPYRQ